MPSICLLFLFLALTIGGQSDPQTLGLQALNQGKYEEAEGIFSKLAEQDPKDYFALFNLALAETGLKKTDLAIQHYQRTLEIKPDLYEALLNLGILYLRNHQSSEALPLLQGAAKQKPDQARVQRYLGDAYLASGNFSAASEAYTAALRLDPTLGAAELGLGQSLAKQGKLDEALPHYRQSATLDPNLKSYLLELANAFSSAKRPADAVPLLKEFPNDVGAREELGRLYLSLNRNAEAVSEFQAALAMSPSSANRLALATAFLKNDQPDLAAPILEQALAASPNDFELRMVVGRIHRDHHDYRNAAAQFVAAAQIKPESVEAWNEAATAFVLSEQYQQALAALDRVRSLKGDTAGDYYYRAIVLDKLHQVKPALSSYQRFLQMSNGRYPDQEFMARQRSRLLEKEANR